MNIQAVIELLNKEKKYNLSSDYYTNIETWRNWWRGFDKSFHEYRELQGDRFVERKLFTLKMAKKVCEDWASILLNEKTEIVIDDEPSSKFLQGKAADLPDMQKKAEASLAQYQARQSSLIKQTGMKRQYERERVTNFSTIKPLKVLTNAAGTPIIRVKQADVKLQGAPNTITQTRSGKGGINRNYYDENGNQYKQISNNHHNHKAVMEFGKQGEHAHDYIYDKDGKLIERPYRELTDDERKENADIL